MNLYGPTRHEEVQTALGEVVMPVQGSVVDKRLEIRAALHGIPVPLDVVVTSPDEFAWRKDVVGTIEWPAAREGKALYSRP